MQARGFTLIETIIVVVVISLTMLIGYPRIRDAFVRSDVRGARNTIASQYAQARTTAMQSGRRTRLRLLNNTGLVLASPRRNPGMQTCDCDTIGVAQNLTERFGVTLSTSFDSIIFDPRGFVSSAATIRVTKSGRTDSLVVSGYGRVIQ